MHQFPPFRFGQNRSTPLAAQLKYCIRGAVAMGLAAFLFLSPLSFLVSAQQPDSPTAQEPDSPKGSSSRDHFILYRNAAGEVACREATLEERRRMDIVNPKGLRQINHLERDSQLTTQAQTADNALPAHLTIILRATSQLEANAPAKVAFLRAAQAWESQIKSPITIYLDADFGSTNFGTEWEPGTLGTTSSPAINGVTYEAVRRRLLANASNPNEGSAYATLPQGSFPIDVSPGIASSMSVSSSIGRAIGLLNPTAEPTDLAARIGFNSGFNYDFDASDGISGGTDFEAVATHEIGHALGFTSRSGGTTNTVPAVWDLFRFRTGTTAATFPSAIRIMTKGPTTGPDQFYFFPTGDPELGLSTGGPNPPTGQTDGDGNQSSHWKHSSLNGGVVIGIMDPKIPGNVRRLITSNDLRALNSFGYNLENSNPPPPSPPIPPVPVNNDFANAQIISTTTCSGSVAGTNVRATRESGEPSHSPDSTPGAPSVWYQWTAPASGNVTITTDGSDYDTLLAVYTGNSVGGLTLIDKNDDVQLGIITTSTLTFLANAGTVYKIAVDGYGGDTGNFVLNWNQGCPASTAKFSTSSYQVAENAGSLQVVVNRVGTTAPATVTYATRDSAGLNACTIHLGDASERCDYQTAVGTLRFAAGEATKTFTIPIIDDAHSEDTETFTVTIKSSSGAVVSSPATATVTIVDNDTTPATQNPIDGVEFFIRQQYLDFLGRQPDAGGFQNWIDTLAPCPNGGFGEPPTSNCDRLHVAAGFFQSDEFLNRGYWAFRFYMVSYNQRPTYAQFIPDMAEVGGPKSPAEEEASKVAFADAFVQRPEFLARYGAQSGQTLANSLLQTAGLPSGSYNAGSQTNGQILRGIAETSAALNKFLTEGNVSIQYFGFLRRDPDTIGYQNNVDTLNANPNNLRHMIFIFIYSTEYRSRFGP